MALPRILLSVPGYSEKFELNKPKEFSPSGTITMSGGTPIVEISQAAYDALAVKDSATLYIITG